MDMIADSLVPRAVAAWSAIRPESREPERIDLLKGRKERKTVCRLAGAGPLGMDVIAKRYRLASGRVERTVYQEILPLLPVASLRCYGLVEEAHGERCWLFLEDAGGTRYSPLIEAHRRLAGTWLGLVHTAEAPQQARALPDRGPAHYVRCLEQSRTNIIACSGNPALGTDHATVLDAVLRELALVDARWPELEALCAEMPRTLVHGDFVPKNLRVRESASAEGATLVCFDWGCAGWGTVAVDLAQAPATARRFAASPDLDAYWSVVRERWSRRDRDTVSRWASVGGVFRALTTIAWATRSLMSTSVSNAVAELRAVHTVLGEAVRSALGPDRTTDDALRRGVEEVLARRRGAPVVGAAIEHRPWDDGSSHPATILSVRLGPGRRDALEIFVKDFAAARYATAEPRRQAEREMRVYRDVLAGAGLGTAELRGIVWDDNDSASDSSNSGRHLLMLELVRGTPLAYRAVDDDWIAAARWLARLQAHAACDGGVLPDVSALLLHHDATFFRATAERALTEVASISRPLADRLSTLLPRYGGCIELMSAQAPTLVHGAYKPRHILVDDAIEPPRICPIDWELAALGSALYDLAFLAYGGRDAMVDRLIDAYRQEAAARDVPCSEQGHMRRVVDCFRAHRALKALGRARERGLTRARIEKLIGSAERLVNAALAAEGTGGGS